jgi:hypothetical protein
MYICPPKMIKGQGEGPNADAEITEGYMPQIPII